MRKLTKKDIIKTSGEFVVKGKDKKNYKFDIIAVFNDDSNKFAWCIAKPAMKYPAGVDSESAVLFRVVSNPKNPTEEIVEYIEDFAKIDEIFEAYNNYADTQNAKSKKKK